MIEGKVDLETAGHVGVLETSNGGLGRGLHGIVDEQCKIGWYRRNKLTGPLQHARDH